MPGWLVAAWLLATAGSALGQPVADFVFPDGALGEDRRVKGPPLREGHTTLEWSADVEGCIFDLESVVASSDFRAGVERYEGPDQVSFISGLETGDHRFRVRARLPDSEEWGPWSEPVIVGVKHQSLTLAWSLFGVGVVLFACIVGFVVWHAKGPRAQTAGGAGASKGEA